MSKLLFQNANIVTSKEVFSGTVLVEGEKIAAVCPAGAPVPGADDARVIDLAGKYLLPGGIDAHTHFDLDVGFTRASDDFYTGSVAAAFGGTTTVIDHLASGPAGCALTHMPDVYQELAKPIVIDYGLHGVIQHVDDVVIADMEKLVQRGITSIKIYLTYGEKVDDPETLRVLERAKELGMVVCVHCENDAALTELRRQFVAQGHTQAKYHPLSRPPQVEAEAVFRVLMLAKMAGETRMCIVHLSSALGLAAARLARADGQANIHLETCPQYLYLDDSKYDDDVEGLKYILSPPLRKPHDIDAIWGGVRAGDFDTIATDHCPFFFGTQKQRGKDDFTECPNGAPGVELRMALLFSKAYQGVISLPRMVQLCSTRPAELFGLAHKKGDIRPGLDADLVVFDPDIAWTVTKSELHENVDYTPYEGIPLQGKPVLTVSRGEVIVENGQLKAEKGRGQYLHRELPLDD